MYTTCCLMVIHPCAKACTLMSKGNKILPQTQLNSWWKYIFYIEVAGQGPIEVVVVRDISCHSDTLLCIKRYNEGQKTVT